MDYSKAPIGTKIDIKCAKESLLELTSSDFNDAIDGMCRWANTKQGHRFWEEVANEEKYDGTARNIVEAQIKIQERGFFSLKSLLEEI